MSMQSLEVISVNLWLMLISLANLGIIYLMFKRFLFKPVKNVIAKRQEAIDSWYREADEARQSAAQSRDQYAQKLAGAQAEADGMIQAAAMTAGRRGDRIVEEARQRADGIIHQAQAEAELEKKKAQETIRREIADVSTALTEKLLGREMSGGDHRAMINAFLDEIGEQHDGNE